MTAASNPPRLVTDSDRIAEIAAQIAEVGSFVFDLEFVSEGRYIPELAVVQVAWGRDEARAAPDNPHTALIDCVEASAAPIFELISSPEIECVAHAATQDLGLLATRFDLRAHNFWDSQIAAAFVGVGEQIGYGNLVNDLLSVRLDKGAQFTNWCARPLTDAQLHYAVNDVLYLPRVWAELRKRLHERGRYQWVEQESEALAARCTGTPAADVAYLSIKGWQALDARSLGALRALAAWRLEIALAKNKPLSWVVPDKAMLDLVRRRVRNESDLRSVRGVGDGTVRRYGTSIVGALIDGAKNPVADQKPSRGSRLSGRAQVWAAVVSNLIQARCAETGVAPRFVGTRSDAEALVMWFEAGAADDNELALLHGWRREMIGADLVAWMRGERVIEASSDGAAALRLREA